MKISSQLQQVCSKGLTSTILTIGALLITNVPVQAQNSSIPSPESILGFKVGADFKLASYEESLDYFQKLEASSDLIELQYAGKTSEDRSWYYAVISSKENLANIKRYKEISQLLAHPEKLSVAQAKALAQEGKPIVHIDGGLHATEVAGAQHTLSLAHYLLTHTEDKKVKDILDNVILLLWPSLNPDGQDIVVNWYKEHVGTPYEAAPIPWLYQKYIGHDNNRDAYMVNMIESRNITRIWREWEPNIIHVHHQSSPFPTRIWLPPFAEPVATRTPPLVAREVNMIGMAIAQELETQGLAGAVHMGKGFDAWYPGYIDYLPVLQNIPAYWTETALYRYATPYFYTLKDFPTDRKGFRLESLYSSPWKGGWWRLSDAVTYMQTASIAVLDYAAKYSEVLLFNKFQAGKQIIEKYKKEPPFAYFIPQKQTDPARPVELLKRLAFNGIRITQLKAQVTFNNISYPKGTWVIPMDQEFGELARQILEIQSYPDLREYPGGPPEQPYDAAGWTLPFQFELNVIAAASLLTEEVRSALVDVQGEAVDWRMTSKEDVSKVDFAPGAGFNTNNVAAGIHPLPGILKGSGPHLILDPKENNIFRILNEAWEQQLNVKYAENKYLISGASKTRINQWINDYAVNGLMTTSGAGVSLKPRIGLYRPWRASMDMGWTRWILDQFGTNYTSLRNEDFIAGHLQDRFDVILIASERPHTIEDGYPKGQVPPRYEGGLGAQGIRNLDQFVSQGGTLVCMNQSSNFAIEKLFLPVENKVAQLKRKDFFTGGSLMHVSINNAHPVMAGMPKNTYIFVSKSPVFNTLKGFEGEALAKYQPNGSPLASGYLLGSEYMNDYAAALDVHHGAGHVILLGFQPQWRGQPMGTFRILFNALLFNQNVAKAHPINTSFWSSPQSIASEKE